MNRITATELAEWQVAKRNFTLLDVRRSAVRTQNAANIIGGQWLDPEQLLSWKDSIARDKPVVVYCAHGHEIGQGIAGTLAAMGLDARYLIDGFSGWQTAGMPVVASSAI